MAVLNGKLYFSWVQRSRLCIPDPTRKAVISKWQSAIGQTLRCKPTSAFLRVLCGKCFPVFSVLLFSVPPCLRGEHFFLIGGRA